MAEHKSPDNHNIIVIEPRKLSQEEIHEAVQKEMGISRLKGELMGLYQEIPKYETRLEEVQKIHSLLDEEADRLCRELEKAEARKAELEDLLKK